MFDDKLKNTRSEAKAGLVINMAKNTKQKI